MEYYFINIKGNVSKSLVIFNYKVLQDFIYKYFEMEYY
jgi:hypothetical protein